MGAESISGFIVCGISHQIVLCKASTTVPYYVRTGLAEEICYIFYLPNDVAVALSLMRSGTSPRFSAREFKLLESVAPIVCSLAQRHWQDVPNWFEVGLSAPESTDSRSIIETTVTAIFGSRITPRETQVVAQVLEGTFF